jgi:hypothetical protein
VRKYNVVIGFAATDIDAGSLVAGCGGILALIPV